MKGYVMILFVNGGLFLVLGLASLGYGLLTHRTANACFESEGSNCERVREGANTSYRFAPFLFAIGLVLGGLAWWYHTRAPPAPKAPLPPSNPPDPR